MTDIGTTVAGLRPALAEDDLLEVMANRSGYRAKGSDNGPFFPRDVDEWSDILSALHIAKKPFQIVGANTRGLLQQPDNVDSQLVLSTLACRAVHQTDLESNTITVDAGITLRELEKYLRRFGLSCGVLPAGTMGSTIGGLLSLPRWEAHTNRAGFFAELCVALRAVAPNGAIVSTNDAPRRATGPDYKYMFLARAGQNGVITRATIRARRIDDTYHCDVFSLTKADSCIDLLSKLAACCYPPDHMIVSIHASSDKDRDKMRHAVLWCAVSGPQQIVDSSRNYYRKIIADDGGAESLSVPAVDIPAQFRVPMTRAEWLDLPSLTHTPPSPTFNAGRYYFSQIKRMLKERSENQSSCIWIAQVNAQGATLWTKKTTTQLAQ